MKVTYHATKRFFQRVLKKNHWTQDEFYVMKQQLEEMFLSVVPGSYRRPFALPKYKGYVVVHQDNTVITILEKDERYRKMHKSKKRVA
jgi:hypothetical protein